MNRTERSTLYCKLKLAQLRNWPGIAPRQRQSDDSRFKIVDCRFAHVMALVAARCVVRATAHARAAEPRPLDYDFPDCFLMCFLHIRDDASQSHLTRSHRARTTHENRLYSMCIRS